MRRATKAVDATPENKSSQPATSPVPRIMSLEKAKKLIQKTSAQHKGLFRRLAK
jgi:hypothetical protein